MEGKKKLLLINNGYPSSEIPNYTTYIKTIYECLVKAKLDVEILAITYHKLSIFHKFKKYLLFWRSLLVKNISTYDIIYINHPPFCFPIFLNRTLYKRTVYLHWHGSELVSNNLFIKSFLFIINNKTNILYQIVPSLYFKQILKAKISLNDNMIFITPSGGVDTQLFHPNVERYNEDKFILGFSSALTSSKGFDIVIEIARKRHFIEDKIKKKIEFHIINYGHNSGYYVNLIKDEKIPFKIYEKMGKNKMPQFYQSIDILLMPSTRIGESLGLVALEAMSCNIPVITYNICAFPEFIIHKMSGERVEKSKNIDCDVDNFISAIIMVISNYSAYKPREIIIDKYSTDYVIQQYEKYL